MDANHRASEKRGLKQVIAKVWNGAVETAWVAGTVVVFVLYPMAMSILEDRFMSTALARQDGRK